jgi:hypothetical protein
MSNNQSSSSLPVIAEDRLIHGEILKFVDGVWSIRGGGEPPPDTVMLAIGTTEAVQCWKDQQVLDTVIKRPDELLPDINQLNEQIPQKEWETGLDGQPKAPWAHVYVVYFVDPREGALYTYLNSTWGAKRAVKDIEQRVEWMRAMRGERVSPLVKLSSKPMKTQYGKKMRPHFEIIEWRELGGGGGNGVLPNKPTPQLTGPAKADPAAKVGKPVKPVSRKEELDGEIPF